MASDRRLASTRLPALIRTGPAAPPIKASAMSHSEAAALSENEEITLRRVAHGQSDGGQSDVGQSDVGHLRAEDLARLRALALVAGTPHAPMLTAAGKARFDQLAKPAMVTDFNAQDELAATLNRLMARKAAR